MTRLSPLCSDRAARSLPWSRHRRPPRRTLLLTVLAATTLLLAPDAPANAAEERSDAVLGATRPQRLVVGRGRTSGSRSLTVRVTNANQRTVPGPGAGPLTVRLVATASGCPAGTTVAMPDFDRATAGAQDTVTLARGASARARLAVAIDAADLATPGGRAPLRCAVVVRAVVELPAGNVDPRPTNDAVEIALDLLDRNDAGSPPATEVLLDPVAPLRVTLDGPDAPLARTARARLRNAGSAPVTITLSGDDGDCLPGTLGALDADPRTAGVQSSVTLAPGRSANATVALSVQPPLWPTADGRSPARCSVRVRAAAPVADGAPSNDQVRIAVDVGVRDAATGNGCAAYASPATPAGNPPSVLAELSGLAASRRHPGVYWAHNDSGNDFELYALGADGALLQTIVLDGANPVDVEDIAVARCAPASDEWCVYLADFGDNGAVRSSVAIYRLPEPDLTPGQTLDVDVLPYTYPGGPRDAEALVAEAVSGRLFVISKILTSLGEVFRLDGLGSPGGGTATSIALLGPTTPADVWATAADAHVGGERVLIRTYTRVWELRQPGALLLEEVFATPPVPVVATAQPQGEAVAFTTGGRGYLLGSEQLAPIARVGCTP